jgi:hypothetical protein
VASAREPEAHTSQAESASSAVASAAIAYSSCQIADLARVGDSSGAQCAADGGDQLGLLEEVIGLREKVGKATAAHSPVMAAAHEVVHETASRHEGLEARYINEARFLQVKK